MTIGTEIRNVIGIRSLKARHGLINFYFVYNLLNGLITCLVIWMALGSSYLIVNCDQRRCLKYLSVTSFMISIFQLLGA